MAAPVGNRNAAKAKVWTAAIERALERRSGPDRVAALDTLAEKLLALCDEGDLAALQELGNRLEGKPTQIIAGEDDRPPVKIQVEGVPALLANADDSSAVP